MSFAPLRDRLLVRPDAQLDHVTRSGIVLQARNGITSPQEQFGRTGTVMAIGPGRLTPKGVLIAPSVQVGDRIMFGEWEYARIDDGGCQWLLVQEADVEAVIE